jgi:serine/threonine protein kinase
LEADRAYRLLRCLRPLCTALAALHREGVYHRHLTPEDVVLLEGRRDHAVLRDFGLAAHPRTPDEGPALYRAPEQARMSAPTLPGPHTDIYQLAALLYHFLTGRAPTSFLSEIEPPSVWNRSLSAELDAALLRALAEAPTDRWPSMNTFCVALAQAAARLRSRLRESP